MGTVLHSLLPDKAHSNRVLPHEPHGRRCREWRRGAAPISWRPLVRKRSNSKRGRMVQGSWTRGSLWDGRHTKTGQ
jgi:hypothetical protein